MRKLARLIGMALVVLMGILFAVGCNTIEGAGRDIEAGGEAIQDAAD
jgi:predicted small secreted protein